MKTALKILATALVAMFFASCSQEAIYYDASGNAVTPVSNTDQGGKAVYEQVFEKSPVVYRSNSPLREVKNDKKQKNTQYVKRNSQQEKLEKKQKQALGCTKCHSNFCPKPDSCGTVSQSVLSRATMQGGTGEPQLGLIPTMKTLAP